MLRIVGCITRQHDYRLVLLAVVVCGVASITTLHTLSRACAGTGRAAWAWLVAAAVAFGSGVWTTHFVAMLAFDPGLPTAFEPAATASSLFIAIGFGLAGFIILTRPGHAGLHSCGASILVGGGIAAMHYLGMAALRVPGLIIYDPAYVLSSVLTGIGFSLAAFIFLQRGWYIASGTLLTLAVCGLHFTAIAAMTIHSLGGVTVEPESLSRALLAIAATAVGLLILAMGLAGSIFDQQLAGRLAQETRRLRALADATFEGVLFETGGIVTDANRAVAELVGCEPAALVGRPIDTLLCPALPLAGPPPEPVATPFEAELLTDSGAGLPVEMLRRKMTETGERSVIAVRDLSGRRAAEQKIQHLAHHDTLTGIANRRLFETRLDQSLRRAEQGGQRVALLCLDLDRFKAVNDLMGHPFGDQLLVHVADRISAIVRQGDTPARLGGDEFAIIAPSASGPVAAAAMADRLVTELGRPCTIDGQEVRVGASVGIALFPEHGQTGDTLLTNADLALYRAKHEGGGCYWFFEPGMDQTLQERRSMEQDLRIALGRGELAVHYQPLHETETLALSGYEALLRWTHPVRGRVSPSEFIPLAEECGLIVPIGDWVLETACAEAVTWARPWRLSVNLSPAQFKCRDLSKTIARALARTGLAPDRLELEVTEGVLIEDADRALAVLRTLKALGVSIALDDFGTGYSSLSYLRKFPFDKVKIDRSFIQGLGHDQDANAIVSSIVAMGRSLRLQVTAEGVETEDQLAQLREFRCGQVQGYLLGRAKDGSHIPTAAQRAPAFDLMDAVGQA